MKADIIDQYSAPYQRRRRKHRSSFIAGMLAGFLSGILLCILAEKASGMLKVNAEERPEPLNQAVTTTEDKQNEVHFIVLCSIDDSGNVTVNDPVSLERSWKQWNLNEISSQIKNTWSFVRP